ncbi:MAG: cyclic pyranopterin monophosphate synthase MoaC [Phycisphaerae bacterium]
MTQEPKQPGLSHVGSGGEARMVDVSPKDATEREASASAVVRMRHTVLDALLSGALPKGDALATARVAGIHAAKRTSEWIPLCHPLPLDWVQIEFSRTGSDELSIFCTAKTTARTGVEMEALTGAAAAALTLYDMAKSADKAIVIGPIQLERKAGGKSGTYLRTHETDTDAGSS